ncbi:hypothetical protein N7456_005677 [Penicillium angulare]|uniref:NADH dehydrogenase [ubiquinone] 1 alpha subcomplex subunit 1 n=1 Tax=Penicillium angulare TaxID=116970 RepID=A0A9W9FYY9_9EURO|nr:hypothetical protein N7456_005677 [Penicillium angulare]
MGVPFEALLPYGIIVGMFGVTGVGLYASKRFLNEGKKNRWNNDIWDRQSKFEFDRGDMETTGSGNWLKLIFIRTVMERDLRITGTWRGQSSNPVAPKGFEVSSPWKLEKRIY